MIHIAVDYHQPWSEVMAMSEIQRKSFIYAAALHKGLEVDWRNGKMRRPPKSRGDF